MRARHSLLAILVCGCLSMCASGQCGPDQRSNKSGGIFVKDFNLVGTQTLTSDQLAEVTGELTGSCFDEDIEELGERVRASFQNRGYFAAEVKHVQLKPIDPLGVPKPVTMEADVSEGARYKLGEVTFAKNRAFPSQRLRQAFPMKAGEWIARDKVAAGLEALRRLYGTEGYLDYAAIPDTEFGSNATVNLRISFDEGPQYRLQKVEILAKKELATKLRLQWKLDEGSVFDHDYVDRYVEGNRGLLPEGFLGQQVQVVRDCPAALVDVRVVVDATEDALKSPPKDVPCESKDKKDPAKSKIEDH